MLQDTLVFETELLWLPHESDNSDSRLPGLTRRSGLGAVGVWGRRATGCTHVVPPLSSVSPGTCALMGAVTAAARGRAGASWS